VTLMDEFQSLGIAFVSLGESLDFTAPAGRLQFHILAALNFLKVKGDFAAAIHESTGLRRLMLRRHGSNYAA